MTTSEPRPVGTGESGGAQLPPVSRRSGGGTLGRGVLLVAIGAILGSVFATSMGNRGPEFPGALFAQEGGVVSSESADGDFLYFTFRRNLWAIHRPSGRVQFLLFPDGREDELVRSEIHKIDANVFPAGEVEYQLSERNLTNYLWILNPVTGKARYIRAGRDGALEFSDVYSVKVRGE